jgi:hypothetical protein
VAGEVGSTHANPSARKKRREAKRPFSSRCRSERTAEGIARSETQVRKFDGEKRFF